MKLQGSLGIERGIRSTYSVMCLCEMLISLPEQHLSALFLRSDRINKAYSLSYDIGLQIHTELNKEEDAVFVFLSST